jgi:hypothetical protein
MNTQSRGIFRGAKGAAGGLLTRGPPLLRSEAIADRTLQNWEDFVVVDVVLNFLTLPL